MSLPIYQYSLDEEVLYKKKKCIIYSISNELETYWVQEIDNPDYIHMQVDGKDITNIKEERNRKLEELGI